MRYQLASDYVELSARVVPGGADPVERERLPGGAWHAWTGMRTLCGLTQDSVTVWSEDGRFPAWTATADEACPTCATRAADGPSARPVPPGCASPERAW